MMPPSPDGRKAGSSNRRRARPAPARAPEIADRLHSFAIHLLRTLRRLDEKAGLTAPRLSALSVIVFQGPISLTALARAEQVQVPTISRLVRSLESDGLVERRRDARDARSVHLTASAKGKRLLRQGRERRVTVLAGALRSLPLSDRRTVGGALAVLEPLVQSLR